MLESIKELHECISEYYIERDKAIEMPLDADGVPWKLTDTEFIDQCGGRRTLEKIIFNTNSIFVKWELVGDGNVFAADKCRHVKPRMVEDVLCDVWNEALDYANSDMWRDPSEVFAERAEEIRDMLGGDA